MQARLRNLMIAGAAVPLLGGFVLAGSSQAASQPMVPLAGNVSPALPHSQRLADVDPHRRFAAAVALVPRDEAGLNRFLAAADDPRSPQYHRFLSPEQYISRFAPTPADVAAVRGYLQRQGLTVTGVADNRQSVDVTGDAAAINRAFGTTMGDYRDPADHRPFYANDSAPALPADLAGKVRGVLGLNDHAVRATRSVRAARPGAPHGANGMEPKDLTGAYDMDGMQADGSGQTVGVWEFDGYRKENIGQYDQKFGLSSPAPATVSVDGANYDSKPGQGQVEVELDIEVINAIAPKANVAVYEAPNSDTGELHMAQQIAKDKKISVLSISWGACEPSRDKNGMTTLDDVFKQIAAEGVSIFAASGDDGSADCSRQTGSKDNAVDFPAADPYVVGVGGTTLTLGSAAARGAGSESAWNGSGGGTSTVFDTPSYQKGVNGKRTVPDVSADADPASGYAVYTADGSGGNGWTSVGGTSAAAPLWAGWAALFGQKAGKPLGDPHTALYKAAGDGKSFHDVTAGGNGGFQAGPGYDQVTGNGTPDGTALLGAIHGG